MSSTGGPAGVPTTPTRKSKFFNVALADEAAQTPRLRVKPSVSSSEKDHDPTTTEADNKRQEARSLSPNKLRRSHSAGTGANVLTPVITPVMKQLKRLSRSATRSASPGKSKNTLTVSVKHEQTRPQSTPPLTTKSPSKKSSRVGASSSTGTSRPDTMSKTLKPPSGRFSMDDVLSDEEKAPERPLAPARSASLPASPPTRTSTAPEKPTSTNSVSESPAKPKHTRHLEDGDLNPKRPSSSKSLNSSRRRRSTTRGDPQGGKERSSTGVKASSEHRSSANSAQPPIHPPSTSSSASKKPPSSSSQSSADVPPRPSSRRQLHPANDEVEKPLSSSSADSAAMRHSNSSTTSDPPPRPKPRRNLSGEGALLQQPSSSNSVQAKKPSSGSSSSEAPPKPSSRRHLSSEDRRHSDSKVPPPTDSSEDHKVRRSRRKPEDRAPKRAESDGGQPKPLNRSRSATPSRRHLGEELHRASAGRDHTKSPSGRRRRSVKEGTRSTSQERKEEAVPDQSLMSPKPTSSSDHHRKKSPGSRPNSPGSRHKPRRTRSESRGSKTKSDEKVRAPPERTRSKSEERPENAQLLTSPKPSTSSDHRRKKSPGYRPTSPSSRHKPRRTRSESRGQAGVKSEEKVRSPPERARSRSEEPEARPKSTATILTSNKSSSSHASRRSAERSLSKSPTSESKSRVRREKKGQSPATEDEKAPSSSRSLAARIRPIDDKDAKRPGKPASLKALLSSAEQQNTRRNLDKQTLQNMRDIKDDFKEMRNRRKMAPPNKLPTRSASELSPRVPRNSVPSSPVRHSTTGITKLSAIPNLMGSLSTVQSSKTDLSTSKSTLSSTMMVELNSSFIGLADLDVGYINPPPAPKPIVSAEQQHMLDLQKEIKKTKKLIKRATREVWADRDEIVLLQRKNWSLRKNLMQTEAPPDSVTTLNMKIEKLVRQERELDHDMDMIEDEKAALATECSKITKNIEEFRDLLEKLQSQIVPLLPPDQFVPMATTPSAPVSPTSDIHMSPSTPASRSEGRRGRRHHQPNPMGSPETLDSTINSTEPDDELQSPLSMPHLHISMSST